MPDWRQPSVFLTPPKMMINSPTYKEKSMRLDKLTTKSQEALQHAQALAEKRNHQAIDVEHLLFALLGQKEGVVLSLLQKLGVPVTSVTERLQRTLDGLPQVTGAAGQTFITPRLKKTIEGAEAEAEALKDEYVSTEHLLLAMVCLGTRDAPLN